MPFNKYDLHLPPYHNFAEEILLGGILINSHIVQLTLPELEVDAFSIEVHQILYRIILQIILQYQNIDAMILINKLWEIHLLQKVGGIQKIIYLVQQAQVFMSSSTDYAIIGYYIQIVKDQYVRRLLIQYGYNIIRLAHVRAISYDTLLFKVNKYLSHIMMIKSKKKLDDSKSSLISLVTNLTSDIVTEDNLGIVSGFQSLDFLTSGFQRSDLIIIAGRPSMGKTSFILSIIANVIRSHEKGILLFSLEMSREQILYKILANLANIPVLRIQKGRVNQQEWIDLQKIYTKFHDSSLYIDDFPNMSVLDLITKSKVISKQIPNLKLIIIDYLQLIQQNDQSLSNRSEQIGIITRQLKMYARLANIPVIVLSQLNRNLETRVSKRPLLSDLKESGCLCNQSPLIIYATDNGYSTCFYSEQVVHKSLIYSQFIKYNEQYTYLVQDISRTSLMMTHNHKLLTIMGWHKLCICKYYTQALIWQAHSQKVGSSLIHCIFFALRIKVYDIYMQEYHSFLAANGYVLHNSIEQDADLVLMLHRESYYKTEMDTNIMEVILAKHRNGPTGSIQLLFNASTSAFINMN